MGLTRKRPTSDIKDIQIKDHVEDIQEEALGDIIELSAAPTASVPLIEDREIGEFSNDIFIRVGNTILKFTPDSTITVT